MPKQLVMYFTIEMGKCKNNMKKDQPGELILFSEKVFRFLWGVAKTI